MTLMNKVRNKSGVVTSRSLTKAELQMPPNRVETSESSQEQLFNRIVQLRNHNIGHVFSSPPRTNLDSTITYHLIHMHPLHFDVHRWRYRTAIIKWNYLLARREAGYDLRSEMVPRLVSMKRRSNIANVSMTMHFEMRRLSHTSRKISTKVNDRS